MVIKCNPSTGKDSFLGKSMGALTGASTAAFMILALESEDWVQPKSFYNALERIGCPPDDIVETL